MITRRHLLSVVGLGLAALWALPPGTTPRADLKADKGKAGKGLNVEERSWVRYEVPRDLPLGVLLEKFRLRVRPETVARHNPGVFGKAGNADARSVVKAGAELRLFIQSN